MTIKNDKVLLISTGALVASLGAMALSFACLTGIDKNGTDIQVVSGVVREALSSNQAAMTDKVNALQRATVEWQDQLRAAVDKPDAIYTLAKNQDGTISLIEVAPAQAAPQPAAPAASETDNRDLRSTLQEQARQAPKK
jgi:hypothetical protein